MDCTYNNCFNVRMRRCHSMHKANQVRSSTAWAWNHCEILEIWGSFSRIFVQILVGFIECFNLSVNSSELFCSAFRDLNFSSHCNWLSCHIWSCNFLCWSEAANLLWTWKLHSRKDLTTLVISTNAGRYHNHTGVDLTPLW
jgi:hypothetical protein